MPGQDTPTPNREVAKLQDLVLMLRIWIDFSKSFPVGASGYIICFHLVVGFKYLVDDIVEYDSLAFLFIMRPQHKA